jgi:butanol dehydrogenase
MNAFDWDTQTKIYFGENKIKKLGGELSKLKVKKVLFLYGHSSIKKNGVYEDVIAELNKANISFVEFSGIDPNPRYTSVLEAAKVCRDQGIDFILAVGGGSVADCAKAISLATFYPSGDFWEEIVKPQKGHTLEKYIPIGVVLTLAATGSEMNSGGVISNMETKEKLALFSPFVRPVFSILDPKYTYSVPANQIAAGVVDAFSHCLEQLFSPERNAITSDGILIGLMWSLRAIGRYTMDNPNDYDSHANLMWTATMALNGLSGAGKTGDWATHQIEHAVSAYYDITHAVGLAIITPYWMEYILDIENVDRFYLVGSLFGVNDDPEITAEEALEDAKIIISEVRDFFVSLGMPTTLSEVGVKKEDIDNMVKSTFAKEGLETIGSIKKLNREDVKNILLKAL